MSGIFKQASLWIVILIILLFGLTKFSGDKSSDKELTSYDFESQLITEKNVKSVDVARSSDELYRFKVSFKNEVDGQSAMEFTTDEYKQTWKTALEEQKIPADTHSESSFWNIFWSIAPLILIFGLFWFFMIRQMQGGSNKAMSFGKS
ncbi:MAG: ATP-dependent metallopeptidase FtsH/Yme1/Tma family protein, partial [Candidatus Hydrogenedentota bacterium]